MEKMSVTRALAELKRLDERIQKALNNQFVDVSVGKGEHKRSANRENIHVAESRIQSNKDTLMSMFDKRNKIKAAVVKSNALTMVLLGGEVISVAEAIERKRSIELKRQLSVSLKSQFKRVTDIVTTLNEKVDQTIELNLATIYGNDKGKVDPSMYAAIAEPQKAQKEAALIDPAKVQQWIEKLDDEISLIDTELDFLLSEINAKTEIEV
jgi:Tfp pilus assembly protein FimV